MQRRRLIEMIPIAYGNIGESDLQD
jgi:hypothetical protein